MDAESNSKIPNCLKFIYLKTGVTTGVFAILQFVIYATFGGFNNKKSISGLLTGFTIFLLVAGVGSVLLHTIMIMSRMARYKRLFIFEENGFAKYIGYCNIVLTSYRLFTLTYAILCVVYQINGYQIILAFEVVHVLLYSYIMGYRCKYDHETRLASYTFRPDEE